MKQTLSREHRKILETTVAQARTAAKALAVAARDALAYATDVTALVTEDPQATQ